MSDFFTRDGMCARPVTVFESTTAVERALMERGFELQGDVVPDPDHNAPGIVYLARTRYYGHDILLDGKGRDVAEALTAVVANSARATRVVSAYRDALKVKDAILVTRGPHTHMLSEHEIDMMEQWAKDLAASPGTLNSDALVERLTIMGFTDLQAYNSRPEQDPSNALVWLEGQYQGVKVQLEGEGVNSDEAMRRVMLDAIIVKHRIVEYNKAVYAPGTPIA